MKLNKKKRRRYLNSEMCECSDDECWALVCYGPASADSPGEDSEESSLSNDIVLCCSGLSNHLLKTRTERLETEWDEPELQNDQVALDYVESQFSETKHLMCTGLVTSER